MLKGFSLKLVASVLIGACLFIPFKNEYFRTLQFGRSVNAWDQLSYATETKNRQLTPTLAHIKEFKVDSYEHQKANRLRRGLKWTWGVKNNVLSGKDLREDFVKQVTSDVEAMKSFMRFLIQVEDKRGRNGAVDQVLIADTLTPALISSFRALLPYTSPEVSTIIADPILSAYQLYNGGLVHNVNISKFILRNKGDNFVLHLNDTMRYYSAYEEYWVKYMLDPKWDGVRDFQVDRRTFKYVGKKWY
jgi:hypothetical protein